MNASTQRYAVIGAGMSGLSCARELARCGYEVIVFDKGRGPGGRVSTRYRETTRYDHGAQYFTTKTERFDREVQSWAAAGIVAPWRGSFASWSRDTFRSHQPSRIRWVGVPTMSRIGRHLAEGIDVRTSTRVVRMTRSGAEWNLFTEGANRHGPFTQVVVTTPGPQALALLPENTACYAAARRLSYKPCWAAMARFEHPLLVEYDGIHADDYPLRWLARDSSKPERQGGERWVMHASPAWSEAAIDRDGEDIAQEMGAYAKVVLGSQPVEMTVHRWRYALSAVTTTSTPVYDHERGLGLCGDGLGGPRMEGAFMSGLRMAEMLIEATR